MGSSGYLGVSQFPLERSTPIEIASGVSSFSASGNHSVFVRNGFLMGMGSNVSGQLGPISTNHVQTPIVIESGVINAVAGNSHTLFTRFGLWGLGENRSLQLGPNAPQTPRVTTPGMAAKLRNECTIRVDWIGNRFAIGTAGYLDNCLYRWRRAVL